MNKYNIRNLMKVFSILFLSIMSCNVWANSAPVITSPSPYNLFVWENESETFTLYATDADGDNLTWSFTQSRYTKRGTLRYFTGGGFQYSANLGMTGIEYIQVTVSDGQASDTLTLRVEIQPTNFISYQFRYHEDLNTTSSQMTSDANTMVSDANNRLRTYNGSGDVACNVKITRSGSVSSYSSGDDTIDTSAELHALANGVNIVREINWCSGLKPNIVGCANVGGGRIAIVNGYGGQSGVLLAHEVGHNQGLSHSSDTQHIMYGSLGNRSYVNASQCNSYMN